MSNKIEARFIRQGSPSDRELHYQIDGNNRVSWQEVPQGERGSSVAFSTAVDAERFMSSVARTLGYAARVGSASMQNGHLRDIEVMRRTGRVPRWAQLHKADSF